MKTFFKYFGLALALQVLLLVLCGLVTSASGPAFESLVLIYEPLILLILKIGNYHGEASMIVPVLFGVPLGIFVYSVVAGGLAVAIRKLSRLK